MPKQSNPQPKPQSAVALFWRAVRDHMGPYHWWLWVALVFLLIDGAAYAAFAASVRVLIDQGILGHSNQALVLVALGALALFSFRALAAFTHRSILRLLGLKVVGDMQKRLASHLLGLEAQFFADNPPGELIERVRGDTTTLQLVLTSAVMSLGRDSVSIIAILGVMIYTDWQWTLLLLVGLPLIAVPVSWLQALVRRTTRKARESSAMLTDTLDEVFHGHRSVRANNRQAHEATRVSGRVDAFVGQQTKAEIGQAALPSMIDIMAGLGVAAVLIFGVPDIQNGSKTLGEFGAFLTGIALLFDPIRRLSSVAGQIASASASLERLFSLLDRPTRVTDQHSGIALQAPTGDIVLRDVHFSYGPHAPVLRGLSLVAPAGKVTALVGPSGAGKSTVFALLARFAEPQSGQVLIGGQDIAGVGLEALRAQLALVSQDTALFNESLAYNIAYGGDFDNQAQIHQAAAAARVLDFADDLTQPVGPRGDKLSGGQRQRVVIARAMMRNAPILLLDEATSALDTKTETLIQQALAEAAAGKTSLVIAHRLSTIQHADLIHVLDAGRVVESGTHAQLLAQGGLYARLQSQLDL